MALSASYFVGEITIPNISGSTVIETANLLDLQIAISKYETYFLKWLLGEDFYDLYAAGIAEVSPEARWTALQNQIYQVNGTLGIGISPAANYVYCRMVTIRNTVTLTNGEGRPKNENFDAWTSREKYVNAWNEMVRLATEIREWLTDNQTTYPEWDEGLTTEFYTVNAWDV